MDLDRDGFVDILSGSYSHMEPGQDMAGHFQLLRGGKEGFAKPTPVKGTDGELLVVRPRAGSEDADLARICTRPTAVDMNGDGHLDIVTGNFGGTFAVFWGSEKGFAPENDWLVGASGKPLQVQMHSDPYFVDWDGDGDQDLVSGSVTGEVVLFPNVGSRTEPAFGPKFELTKAPKNAHMGGEIVFGEEHITGPQGSTRVAVVDVDGDGKLDLLVGDSATVNTPAEGLSEDECRAKLEAWNEEYQKVSETAPDISDWENMTEEDEEAFEVFREKMNEIYERRSSIIDERRTGFVWLYRQK